MWKPPPTVKKVGDKWVADGVEYEMTELHHDWRGLFWMLAIGGFVGLPVGLAIRWWGAL